MVKKRVASESKKAFVTKCAQKYREECGHLPLMLTDDKLEEIMRFMFATFESYGHGLKNPDVKQELIDLFKSEVHKIS